MTLGHPKSNSRSRGPPEIAAQDSDVALGEPSEPWMHHRERPRLYAQPLTPRRLDKLGLPPLSHVCSTFQILGHAISTAVTRPFSSSPGPSYSLINDLPSCPARRTNCFRPRSLQPKLLPYLFSLSPSIAALCRKTIRTRINVPRRCLDLSGCCPNLACRACLL